ncbi:MAG TPA: oxygenase MpaB family protein [Thermoleophilaceae bacterium]|nr:oxygenase MpaB family protein [Thermoleophilaceae bacterium]
MSQLYHPRQWVTKPVTEIMGRHDERELYAQPPGDPGLCGPGSVSWQIHSDLSAIAVAGTAAITMELLHPSVMAGVSDLSTYRTDPLRRARNTAGYVIATTFAGTAAAEDLIARVRRVHGRIAGVRPDGVAYRASDPVLLGWVHTSIPWMVMRAYERYTRPLLPAERDRYLAEQAVIGRLGGAGEIPETVAELDEYVETMRPELAVTEQTREFFDFLVDSDDPLSMPGPLRRPGNAFQLHASLSLLPAWARALTGYDHPAAIRRRVYDPHLRRTARTLRWAFGTPPYAGMAAERAAAARAPAAVAA